MKSSSKTKFVILGLLTIQPLSGYEIRRLIGTSISHFWAESNGQIYPTLKQLVKDKWITLHEKRSSGKKLCHHYAVTSEGRMQLTNWLETAEEKKVHRDEGLLKLFFGGNVSVEESIRRLKEREKRITQKLKTYDQIKQKIEEEIDSPQALFWELTLHHGFTMAEAELNWCRASINCLEQGKV